MSRAVRWSVATLLCVAGCGAAPATVGPPVPMEAAVDEAPVVADEAVSCEFRGEMFTDLFSPSGTRYATVRAMGWARLLEVQQAPLLEVSIQQGLWSLSSEADASERGLLGVDQEVALSPTVSLVRGARVKVSALGEDGLTIDASALLDAARVELVGASAVVESACDELSMQHPEPSDGLDGAMLNAVGDQPLELSAEPGGEVSARVAVASNTDFLRAWFRRRGEEGEFTQIERRHRGVRILGWVPSARMQGALGGLGLGGGMLPQEQGCTLASDGQLVILTATGTEEVGNLQPGTAFVSGVARAAGRLFRRAGAIRLGDAPLLVVGGDPQCSAIDPVAEASPQGPGVRVTTRVTSVEGLSGVEVGSECVASIENTSSGCRAAVRCGEVTLFGDRRTNGYVPGCEYSWDPPRAAGEDPEPSSVRRGDPMFSFDSDQGVFRLSDVAVGRLGAFTLEATIVSTTHAPDLSVR